MGERNIIRLSEDPYGFFKEFDSIVLVANSKDAAAVLDAADLGKRPLFVFFNRVYRIIEKPFRRDCILVSRSSPIGSSLVWRGELDDVLSLLKGPDFHGILNVRAQDRELFSKPEQFKNNMVGFLDLCDWVKTIYPAGRRMPSTGFALAAWIAELRLPVKVYLSGFSGVRDAEWRIYDSHDWSWEQIVLNLLYRQSMLHEYKPGEASEVWPFGPLKKRFPEFSDAEMSATAAEVLSNRISGTNRVIDDIYPVLKPQLALRWLMRRLRPMSRKAKVRKTLLEDRAKAEAAKSTR